MTFIRTIIQQLFSNNNTILSQTDYKDRHILNPDTDYQLKTNYLPSIKTLSTEDNQAQRWTDILATQRVAKVEDNTHKRLLLTKEPSSFMPYPTARSLSVLI